MSKKTVKVSMELPELPEGFEYTGEYRAARGEEYFLSSDGVQREHSGTFAEYPIIRKCEVWRDATAQDIYSALSGVEVFVRYGGKMLRLVGGELCNYGLTFLLKREDLTTFLAGACEVRVS